MNEEDEDYSNRHPFKELLIQKLSCTEPVLPQQQDSIVRKNLEGKKNLRERCGRSGRRWIILRTRVCRVCGQAQMYTKAVGSAEQEESGGGPGDGGRYHAGILLYKCSEKNKNQMSGSTVEGAATTTTAALPNDEAGYIVRELYSAEQIRQRVRALAQQIHDEYRPLLTSFDDQLVLVAILKGAFIFASDLSRELSALGLPNFVEFMALATYGDSTSTTGAVRVIMDLKRNIENKHVLVVEDIIDTGYTLSYLRANLLGRRPASLRISTFLSKPASLRKVDVPVDYIGFEYDGTEWVGGYGLDWAEHFRTLPVCVVLNSELLNKRKKH
ncbi:hypoxanthine phosphoribosyltransferase [Pelomyxa schiedti]|nr:hypoxanthine phosphoribosyltransferase [Pelomyxa schiedti]